MSIALALYATDIYLYICLNKYLHRQELSHYDKKSQIIFENSSRPTALSLNGKSKYFPGSTYVMFGKQMHCAFVVLN